MANPVELSRTVRGQWEEQQVNQIAVGNLEKQGLALNVVVFPPPIATERPSDVVVFSLKPPIGRLPTERTGGVYLRKKTSSKKSWRNFKETAGSYYKEKTQERRRDISRRCERGT